MAHGDAVGDSDSAEFAGRAPAGGNAKLDRLGLPHQRDVAGRRLVPAGGHADEGLMNLLPRQPHGVIERPVRRAIGPFGGVTAWQPQFQVTLGVHLTLASQLAVFAPLDPVQSYSL